MQVTDPQQIETYYQALVERNPEFLGTFFACVKTTSIFCIPTCRARKPKPENVTFFTTFKEALDHGFRPCKICKPTQHAYEAPPAIQKALQMLKDSPQFKVKDWDLRQAGISPEAVRRWFKKQYGLTFQAYQRMTRINLAFEALKNGKSATHTALDAGYESLSGFGYTYKKLMGNAPQNSLQNAPILIHRFTTPLGPMFVCATEQGVCLLEFTDRRMLESEFKDLQNRLKAPIINGENAHTQQAEKELGEYFEGKRTTFDLQLHTPGTDFQQQVWEGLHKIAYGKTASYQQQAIALGKPTATRAVARANGMNRVAIVIPCHRVIGKDGSLTGYGGGLERKRWLLAFEKKQEQTSLF